MNRMNSRRDFTKNVATKGFVAAFAAFLGMNSLKTNNSSEHMPLDDARAVFDAMLPTDGGWREAGERAGLEYGKDFWFSDDEDQDDPSVIERLSGIIVPEASAGCAWYNTAYKECRPYWQCTSYGGVRTYQQQAYYCSDRSPGPLAYRFVWTCCGCSC